MPGTKLLRLGGKAQERVDLAVDEELHWPDGAAGDPINILAGVDTDIAGDDGQKQMRGRAKGFDPHTLALEIENAVNPFVPKHFKAPDMHRAEGGYRQTAIERGDEHRGKIRTEIDLAAGDRLGCVDGRRGVP